jgi:hypothetical protein
MSTIDKASLIQIPSGYKNGKLYSVKPNPTYGSELVTNGDFATDSDWTKAPSGVSISGGSANFNASADSYIYQDIITVGKTYKVTFSGVVTSGAFYIGENGQASNIFTQGTYVNQEATFTVLASTRFIIRVNSAPFVGSIDNVSVKEITNIGDFTFSRSSSATRVNSEGLIETASVVSTTELVTNGDFATDSDWTKGSGWTISNGKATKSGTDLAYLTQSSLISVVGKTYRVKASITNITTGNIRIDNFTSGTTYTSNVEIDITYTATSTGVFRFLGWGGFDGSIDNVSVKEVFENDVPRLDYSGGASCASLLLESQRTNLLRHSTNFSGNWSLDDATKVSDSTISPDGNNNAITLIGNTNASRHNISQSASGSVTASLSVFAKAKELRYLQIASANSTNQYVNFDVSDGTIGTVGSSFSDAKIEDYGNGWYRCSVTSTNQYNAMYISLVSSLTSSWLESWTMSNNTDGLYLYGAQLEQGSYPTSYIPTTTATVTRTADVCNNAGTSATFNSTEGVLFAEIAALANDGTKRRITINNGSSTQFVQLEYSVTTNTIKVGVYNGSLQGFFTETLSDLTTFNKIAYSYKANEFKLFANGIQLSTTITSGTTFSSGTLSTLSFDNGASADDFYGNTKQLMTFNEALSDEELSDLTGQVNLSFNNLATFYNYTIL